MDRQSGHYDLSQDKFPPQGPGGRKRLAALWANSLKPPVSAGIRKRIVSPIIVGLYFDAESVA